LYLLEVGGRKRFSGFLAIGQSLIVQRSAVRFLLRFALAIQAAPQHQTPQAIA